jgi:hypothetical protein
MHRVDLPEQFLFVTLLCLVGDEDGIRIHAHLFCTTVIQHH